MACDPVAATRALFALLRAPERESILATLHDGTLGRFYDNAVMREEWLPTSGQTGRDPEASIPAERGAAVVGALIEALPPSERHRTAHVMGYVLEQPDMHIKVRARLGAEYFCRQGDEQGWVMLRLEPDPEISGGAPHSPHLVEVRRFSNEWKVCSWTPGAFPLRALRQVQWWM